MKNLVIIAIAFFTTLAFAQKERTLTLNKETNLIDVVYYHNNGEVSQTGSYTADGKLQGNWISFNEEGKKTVSAKYDNGKKVGKWTYWTNESVKEVDYSKNVIAGLKESPVAKSSEEI
jgi:antitoxin component YwqK of YwqJK toxin-antitoxin module